MAKTATDPTRFGAMALLGAVFIGSASARLLDPSGAIAQEATAPDPAPAVAHCAKPEAPEALLAALKEREMQLASRADVIADRERLLEAAELRFRAQADRLQEAEAQLSATLARADEAAESDVTSLVEVYETMNPKNAAQIFEAMDITFAAGFLSRMQRDAAARILSGLPPDRAYAVSVVIAGRNASAPRE
ncbi:MAG: hypothetical protein AAF192_21295 [Pseudomonadota bacterium]